MDFKNLNDLRVIDADTLYRPEFRTLAGVDAFTEKYVFQVTVGKTHTLNAQGVLDVFHLTGHPVPIVFLLHSSNFAEETEETEK